MLGMKIGPDTAVGFNRQSVFKWKLDVVQRALVVAFKYIGIEDLILICTWSYFAGASGVEVVQFCRLYGRMDLPAKRSALSDHYTKPRHQFVEQPCPPFRGPWRKPTSPPLQSQFGHD